MGVFFDKNGNFMFSPTIGYSNVRYYGWHAVNRPLPSFLLAGVGTFGNAEAASLCPTCYPIDEVVVTWKKGWYYAASGGGGEYYNNQYGNPSATLDEFASYYKGKTENQIVFGQSSFLGYKYPNDINKQFRFVKIGNGREVDMIHFMVVGRRGHVLGVANELKQALSFSKSAFYPQDLYSNKLGVNFFNRYESVIQQNPTRISEYIQWFLTNPDNW